MIASPCCPRVTSELISVVAFVALLLRDFARPDECQTRIEKELSRIASPQELFHTFMEDFRAALRNVHLVRLFAASFRGAVQLCPTMGWVRLEWCVWN